MSAEFGRKFDEWSTGYGIGFVSEQYSDPVCRDALTGDVVEMPASKIDAIMLLRLGCKIYDSQRNRIIELKYAESKSAMQKKKKSIWYQC